MAKKIPSGIVWRIFFSISALRVDVISDAIKPGATAFACKDKVTKAFVTVNKKAIQKRPSQPKPKANL